MQLLMLGPVSVGNSSHYPDSKKPRIDIGETSNRHFRVGSMSNRCRFEGLCCQDRVTVYSYLRLLSRFLLSGVLAAGGMGGSAYFQTTESGHDDSRGADDNHYPWNHHTDKQRVLMHRHQGWNVRHGLCHIYMRYIYIYIWVVYSFCLFCCLFIIVTWWYIWCIVWQVASKRKYRHVW